MVDFGLGINQNAPVLAGVDKGPDWAVSPPPAAPQDGGGLDPKCNNETTKRMRSPKNKSKCQIAKRQARS